MINLCGCAGLADLDRRAAPLPHPPLVIDGHLVPPVQPPLTLSRFLGLDVVCRRGVLLGQVVREKAATAVPALAPKALPLPTSHPAAAASPSPAVASAHKVHQAKVAKVAKVKAVKQLASADCADPVVREGIVAALDDPAAEVRIAAIEAVLASRRGCDVDCCGGCCDEAIRARLTYMVYEKTGPRCWAEPNSQARRLARLALDVCGGPAPASATARIPAAECAECPPPEIIDWIDRPPASN